MTNNEFDTAGNRTIIPSGTDFYWETKVFTTGDKKTFALGLKVKNTKEIGIFISITEDQFMQIISMESKVGVF